MSPARSHVEQSRNTLLFATCAKQVATKAQVNVVMSDKALVRQLQKELARLENELKALKSRSVDEKSALVLKEKEDVIEKMNKEMRELMMQRDIAQSRMQNLLHSRTSWDEISYQSETPEDHTDASEASETPLHHHHHHIAEASASSRFDDAVVDEAAIDEDQFLSNDTSPRLFIHKFFGPDPCQDLLQAHPAHRSDSSFASDSCKEVQCIEMGDDSRIAAAKVDLGGYYPVDFDEIAISAESKKFAAHDNEDFLDVIVKEHKFKISMDEDDGGVTVHEAVEAMPEKQFRRGSEDSKEVGDGDLEHRDDESEWPQEFEKKRGEIIELWDACHVPLVHRTYFFLLFKGDPSDAVYMEVELRRLHFLKNSWSQGEKIPKDGQNLTEAASIKSMKREREMLCKQMLKIFSANERNKLFREWGIRLNTKQRRLQLCDKLWKDNTDKEHLNRSASLVAKLVGIAETNDASKAMFGLNFAPQPMNHLSSYTWAAPRMPFMAR
ncbi:unnamed protein product [Cuscuta campestris]|uniref:Kinesin motor domain-containing protein n=1 Tax=Cuscuta campestris TaxID=132261 RepID=A0A484KEC7_9ASTE|nr:unnamed protein product [Cuscuta campestris]